MLSKEEMREYQRVRRAREKEEAEKERLVVERMQKPVRHEDGSLILVQYRCQACNKLWSASRLTLSNCPYCRCGINVEIEPGTVAA